MPPHQKGGQEVAAARGAVGSVLGMLEGGVTHLGVATDYVIESFRNDLWPGYKSSFGVDPRILSQFRLLEDGFTALGVRVWPMVELEADDALASAALLASRSDAVDKVYICTPDKDLGQCVGGRVVQLDRRTRTVIDEAGVVAKFGVPPSSIPDYLALVGDSADGFPGLPGWGAKTAATVLARYRHLEAIPVDPRAWDLPLRGLDKLCQTLVEQRDLAFLFRNLATLRTNADLFESVDDLRWDGPAAGFEAFCNAVDAPQLFHRASRLAEKRLFSAQAVNTPLTSLKARQPSV
jgi:5'-3' exonuclease